MSKLICTGNSVSDIEKLLLKDINGIILYIDKLSVNSSFYMDIDDIDKIECGDKELFICMNKLMHNKDIDYLRECLLKVRDKNLHILFYDMAVYNIARELGIEDKLVIYQDHLNASILSNRFYNRLGIKYSFITSDITMEELLLIKRNVDSKIMFLGYGYLPIFYSRRYLISNYLKYIDQFDGEKSKYEIVSDMGKKYTIAEEENGTTIYTDREVNLINYMEQLDEIDYIVMNSNNIDSDEYLRMVDKFIKREKMDDCYLGFLDKKTIYKVKGAN
ncbi:MAG: U32 family peptidase [Erysipelotrichaceae bacterium]|nr:U32 family peptidase [Erysipelotrichaceae bacterium]